MTLDRQAREETRSQIIATVRDFVQREVEPVAGQLERDDVYPTDLVNRMAELGFFGIVIPERYGGLGLDYTTFATIFEELARGWMSLTGPLGTHHILAYILLHYGSEEQRRHYLPRMARGEVRGALALTEPSGGSDVAAMQTRAVRDGDEYVVNGSKLFITNAEHAHVFALLAKTDLKADPPHRGISCFVAEKGPGFNVGRHLDKLGYRSIDTCELFFQDYRVPAVNLVGGKEGQGFYQVMSALETGRINVAARAVGVAQAAFEHAIRYAQQRRAFGKPIAEHQAIQLKLADMYTKTEAARLLVRKAAERKDAGERVDLEAGMAKLFASEVALEVATEAMRIHGGAGYVRDYPVERYFRDAPLMIIGEGTNEVQRLVIARNLLKRFQI